MVPAGWLVLALVVLVGFRVGLNVVDSNVIDVGYAGVIGADRIADGDPLYGDGFSERVRHGDTYGPLSYLTYVPFEQALPWGGKWDDLPAAHGAAILFDLGHPGRADPPGPPAAARTGGSRAGRRPRIRLGHVPVRDLRASDQLQRRAGGHVHGARDARPGQLPGTAASGRRRAWAGGGAGGRREVRPCGPRPPVRPRHRAPARGRCVRRRARRGAGRARPVPSSGTAARASSTTAPSATRRRADRRSACGDRCRRSTGSGPW